MKSTRNKRLPAAWLLAVGLLAASLPVFAHHSQAPYDEDTLITLKGTVEQFEYINPHAIIRFKVKDSKGNVEDWVSFQSAPGILSRSGWTYNQFKPGEEITIIGFPQKDGRKIMIGVKHIRPGGVETPEAWPEQVIYQGYLNRRAKEGKK